MIESERDFSLMKSYVFEPMFLFKKSDGKIALSVTKYDYTKSAETTLLLRLDDHDERAKYFQEWAEIEDLRKQEKNNH